MSRRRPDSCRAMASVANPRTRAEFGQSMGSHSPAWARSSVQLTSRPAVVAMEVAMVPKRLIAELRDSMRTHTLLEGDHRGARHAREGSEQSGFTSHAGARRSRPHSGMTSTEYGDLPGEASAIAKASRASARTPDIAAHHSAQALFPGKSRLSANRQPLRIARASLDRFVGMCVTDLGDRHRNLPTPECPLQPHRSAREW